MEIFRVRLRHRNVCIIYFLGILILVVLYLSPSTRSGLEGNGFRSFLVSPLERDYERTSNEGVLPSRTPIPLETFEQETRSEDERHQQFARDHDLSYEDFEEYFLNEKVNPTLPKVVASPETLRARAFTYSNTSSMRAFLREQVRRADHVSKMCHTFEPQKTTDAQEWMDLPRYLFGLTSLLIDRTNPIAFCPVPKVASTTWSITLLEIVEVPNIEQRREREVLVKTLGNYFPKYIKFDRYSKAKGSTRFMIVRHPLERLVSCYRFLMENARKVSYYRQYGHKMVRQYRKVEKNLTVKQIAQLQEEVYTKVIRKETPIELPGNPFAEPVGPTFREFAQYITHTKQSDDQHWRPIIDHCSPCHLNFEFILRFEDLNEEGKLFIEYLNKSSQVKMRWENPTKGGRSKDFICKYFSQLTTEMINDLIHKYEKDLILYKYKPELYLNCVNNNTNIKSEYSGPTPDKTTLGPPTQERNVT